MSRPAARTMKTSVALITVSLVALPACQAHLRPPTCLREPAPLVEEFYRRLDGLAQHGYADADARSVYDITVGQASEVVKSDVVYFGSAGVRQEGSTRVDVRGMSPLGESGAGLSVDVLLDVSGLSYVRTATGSPVTSNSADEVPVVLGLETDGECLRVSTITYMDASQGMGTSDAE